MRKLDALRIALGGLAFAAAAGVGCARARRRAGFHLNDRVVVVTGGSRGLGLQIAREAACQGARIALIARHAEDLERAGMDLRRQGIRVVTIACDVTDALQVEAAIACVAQHFGRIDVLVNNAGVIQVGPLDNMRVEDFRQSIDTHVFGPLHTTLAARPHLRKTRGRVVNISSIGGRIAPPHLLPYAAGKFGLVGLSEGLRTELSAEGILVTTVCPGLMRTGSAPNAQITGRKEAEYAWFAICSSLPGLSMSASRAARKILRSAREGRARVTLGAPARVAAFLDQAAPGVFSTLAAVANRFLPAPAPKRADAGRLGSGWQSESRWAPSMLTRPTYKAAMENHEAASAGMAGPVGY